jgi:hypothetical protein
VRARGLARTCRNCSVNSERAAEQSPATRRARNGDRGTSGARRWETYPRPASDAIHAGMCAARLDRRARNALSRQLPAMAPGKGPVDAATRNARFGFACARGLLLGGGFSLLHQRLTDAQERLHALRLRRAEVFRGAPEVLERAIGEEQLIARVFDLVAVLTLLPPRSRSSPQPPLRSIRSPFHPDDQTKRAPEDPGPAFELTHQCFVTVTDLARLWTWSSIDGVAKTCTTCRATVLGSMPTRCSVSSPSAYVTALTTS